MTDGDSTSDEAEVSVVIVNWNGETALRRCLPSLVASASNCPFSVEVIVVDNGSDDGSLGVIRSMVPTATVVANDSNLGFSPAANQGIRCSHGAYVALLNNDTVCDPDWLRELHRVLESDTSVGSAAAQLRYLGDPNRINSAGLEIDLLGRPYDARDGELVDTSSDVTEVFGASAGAAMFRRTMLEGVGLFDERFFAYVEDADLAWRAQRLGWRAVHVPSAVVLHEYSATSGRQAGLKARLSSRNLVWMIAKNASPVHLILAACSHAVFAMWTAALALARRDSSAVVGLAQGVRTVMPMLAERHAPYLPMRCFSRPQLFGFRRATRHRPARHAS